MPKETIDSQVLLALRKRLSFFRVYAAAITIICVALTGGLIWMYLDLADDTPRTAAQIQEDAPNDEIVEKIISRLRYSGYPDLMRPDVYIDVDFESGVWALKNIHRFDEKGNILLMENRYGVCGDLAAYTYQKIKPYFPEDKYSIQFVEAVESSYFQEETGGRHVILRIVDLTAGQEGTNYKKVYILDPALRRYGTPEYFDDYLPIRIDPSFALLQMRSRDEIFDVEQGPPVIINRKGYISLFMNKQDGKFDPDNYVMTLSVTRRYRFVRRTLFTIRKSEGRVTFEEQKYPIEKVISSKMYAQLRDRIRTLHADFESELLKSRAGGILGS